ncbi:MAG: hypothetical protein KAH23_04325 [Kiritimatiellae bacterium]|nr:hypothetical protein [Kiritimatiellia bacterium]
MKFQRKIRQVGESLLIGLSLCVIPLLSRRMVVSFSKWVANLAFCHPNRLKRMALANLDLAFPQMSAEEKECIAKESFCTFALMIIDLFWFGRFTAERVAKYVKLDSSFDLYFEQNPVILITGHIGNWEVLGLSLGLQGNDPCTSVAMPLINPFADRVLNRFRVLTGLNVVPRQGAVRTIMKILKEGGKVALLMDQNTLPDAGGEFVEFFGLPVPVSKTVSALSEHTSAHIVYVFCTADSDGVYAAKAYEGCLDGDKSVQALTACLEAEIRRNPGKWLWMYKRWRYIPDGYSEDKYPYYSERWEAKKV